MARRLKIAFVVDSARSGRAGGLVAAERVIEALRRDHDVTSIGVGGDVQLPALSLPFGDEVVASNSFIFAKPDINLMARAFDAADVVHVQLPFFLGYHALSLAEELRVPVVAGHHVQPENVLRGLALIAPCLAGTLGSPVLARALNRAMTRTFYNRAAALICPSQLSLDELRAAGLTRPAEIISNGAPAQFAPLPSRPPGPFTVLTVGRLVPEKRHDLVIEAVRRSRHAASLRLVISGRGPLRQKLEEQARDLPGGVEFGFKSDEELLRLYQTADLYVHPSEVELEGMAVLEAMRCGCPAVISDSGSSATKQFALDEAHVFRTGDVQALSARLDDWFENPARLAQRRQKTLTAVEAYGLENTIAAYERVYERVASQRFTHLRT